MPPPAGAQCEPGAVSFTETHEFYRESANSLREFWHSEKSGAWSNWFGLGVAIWTQLNSPDTIVDAVNLGDESYPNPDPEAWPGTLYTTADLDWTNVVYPSAAGFGLFQMNYQVMWDYYACSEQGNPVEQYELSGAIPVNVARPSFTLTATPAGYIPMNNLAGAQAVPGCPVGGTVPISPNPSYTVAFQAPDGADWRAIIKFRLSEVSSLPGHSTNGCFHPRCSSGLDGAPDFDFVLPDQTQQIFNAPVRPDASSAEMETSSQAASATAVVSSFDFGGKAKLSAIARFEDGSTMDASAGPLQYTRIPVDEDGNGIADAWETPFRANPTLPLAPGEDNDGTAGDVKRGDGYSIHDEYRGFTALDSNGAPCHTRTNPVAVKDVFYWDSSTAAACGPLGEGAGCFGRAVSRLLRPGAAPTFEYRSVPKEQVNAVDYNLYNPLQGVIRFNRNSSYGAILGYAIVFTDAVLMANCLSFPVAGEIGNASSQLNDGKPIRIDLIQVAACSALQGYPSDVFLARTVAHETGHKFGLAHTVRPGPVRHNGERPTTPAALYEMPMDEYTCDPNYVRALYARLTTYSHLGAIHRPDAVLELQNLAGNPVTGYAFLPPPNHPPNAPPPAPTAIYQVQTGNPIPSFPNTILIQDVPLVSGTAYNMMAWTVRWDAQTNSSWTFTDGDIRRADAVGSPPSP